MKKICETDCAEIPILSLVSKSDNFFLQNLQNQKICETWNNDNKIL